MKLALAGLFLALAVFAGRLYTRTGDVWAAVGCGGFAVASIASSVPILKGYRGGKR
jgi:hypothetical protein